MRTLVWFRGKDLRVADHAPLTEAAARGEIVPLFVLDPYFFAPERARRIAHRMQFLLESLRELEQSIARLGSRLLLVEGRSVEVVPRLAALWRVDRVVAQRWCEPFARERDRRVAASLAVPFELFEGELLHAPGTLRGGAGQPFSVFTAFARAFARDVPIGRPLPAPKRLPALPAGVRTRASRIPTLKALGIRENPSLPRGGERAAHARLATFLAGPAGDYARLRDRLDLPGTSRLSVDLKFGTLSPRAVWNAVADTTFRKELVWREFAHSTLWDHPDLLETPFRPEWKRFPWRKDERGWRAWVEGTTGYPLVDAAARQLIAEGFVHNRARMVAASFLVKHLLIDFRRGEEHYLSHLVDGDWANNDLGWQWSAGCGCDAQPWFRIFNPIAQAKRFDPTGTYVRRWAPEPHPPIIDHGEARARFLALARRLQS
jgi:deoxyribodipyrimidine photo-lyase